MDRATLRNDSDDSDDAYDPGSGSPEPETILPELLAPSRADDFDDADFAVVLLHALTSMAERSKRRQADLMAALRGAAITADPGRVRLALRLLQLQGAIENLVPLSDGGLLLSVTQRLNDHAGPAPEWLPIDLLDATAD
jgi:hypothetical protein